MSWSSILYTRGLQRHGIVNTLISRFLLKLRHDDLVEGIVPVNSLPLSAVLFARVQAH